jgi:hypothetical protein
MERPEHTEVSKAVTYAMTTVLMNLNQFLIFIMTESCRQNYTKTL